jgi:hypothetical protein
MKPLRPQALIALAVLVFGMWLSATTVIPMSVEELTSAATQIIRAHVIESRSAWDDQHSTIYTYTRFQTDETLKGSRSSVITVKQLGGSAEGYTLHVAGVHPWSKGDNVVLFLRPSQDQDGTFSIVGLMQGDFRLRRSSSGEMVADNGLHLSAARAMSVEGDVHSYNPPTKQLSMYSGSQLTLGELEARVHAAAAGGKNLQ